MIWKAFVRNGRCFFCARSAPGIFEPFFMRFMGKLHIPQELRIRSGGTERHSASN